MRCFKSLIVFAGILISLPAYAEISTDGSLGSAISLKGPIYDIRAELGRQIGKNLYHGFNKFDLEKGEQAVFKGPETIENIIGKISGGRSNINGLIKSEIYGANLFLINPQGMFFGPDATLDITGSFYVSSYEIGFPQQLSGDIEFKGTRINVRDGKTIFAASDQINMTEAVLEAKSGSIFIIANHFFAKDSTLNADTGGSANGQEIAIHALITEGQNVKISTDAIESGNGGNITISGINDQAAQSVRFSDGAKITAGAFSDGNAGTITIRADDLSLSNDAYIGSESFGSGSGGSIALHVNKLRADKGGVISIESAADGSGGNLVISGIDTGNDDYAKSVSFSGKYSDSSDITPDSNPRYFSQIYAATQNFGHAGNIRIRTEELSLSDEAFMRSQTSGSGRGGDIEIHANSLKLYDNASINSDTTGSGSGGQILIRSQIIDVRNSKISVDTGANGKGGSLTITGISENTPSELINLSDGASLLAGSLGEGGNAGSINILANTLKLSGAYIGSEAFGRGRGGDIRLCVRNLSLTDGSEITVKTAGSGMGGTIHIAGVDENKPADTVTLSGHGYKSRIYADSSESGEAGNISIYSNNLRLGTGDSVSTSAQNADGGNIVMTIPGLFYLDNAEITTSVSGGAGNGGNIEIRPDLAVLRTSRIIANAYEGRGGNIHIWANHFIATPATLISASSKLGIDGRVEIDTNYSNIISDFTILPTSFQDMSVWLQNACEARSAENTGGGGSLRIKGRGGMPDDPEDFLK